MHVLKLQLPLSCLFLLPSSEVDSSEVDTVTKCIGEGREGGGITSRALVNFVERERDFEMMEEALSDREKRGILI